jgi:hypothetical protein
MAAIETPMKPVARPSERATLITGAIMAGLVLANLIRRASHSPTASRVHRALRPRHPSLTEDVIAFELLKQWLYRMGGGAR